MINHRKAKEHNIKPERVRELIIAIESQGNIDIKELRIYNEGKKNGY